MKKAPNSEAFQAHCLTSYAFYSVVVEVDVAGVADALLSFATAAIAATAAATAAIVPTATPPTAAPAAAPPAAPVPPAAPDEPPDCCWEMAGDAAIIRQVAVKSILFIMNHLKELNFKKKLVTPRLNHTAE
jgi:hypothetical protein